MNSWIQRRTVDAHSPGGAHRLAIALASSGAVVIDDITDRHRLLRLAMTVMNPLPHRDADADGITSIRPHLPHPTPGNLGFGSGPLAVHTDGAQHAQPAGMLIMSCAKPAVTGGETVVVDMAAVHDTLAAVAPTLLTRLYRPECRFGGKAAVWRPVFCRTGTRVSARWRDDALAAFSPDIAPHLPLLREIINRHRITVPLAYGQAVILSNTRFLHGRNAFDGDRLMLRIIGNARSDLTLPPGFANTVTTTHHPTPVPA